MTTQPISRTCVSCGQLTLTSADPLCDRCYEAAREPQGAAVRLFEPAPAHMPGQLALEP
jgi:NMD protein affecting ribosome stability and mRNA decay